MLLSGELEDQSLPREPQQKNMEATLHASP